MKTRRKFNLRGQLERGVLLSSFLFLFFTANSFAGLRENPQIQLLEKMEQGFSEITKFVQSKVVFISVSKLVPLPNHNLFFMDPFEELFGAPRGRRGTPSGPPPAQEQKGLGSGFIININKGYILTNNHVVGDADEIVVKTFDNREYKATVVGTDPKTDVAVIKVENLPKELGEIQLGDSSNISIGQWAIAVGAPLGLAQSITRGTVSAKGRGSLNITGYGDFIQTDAAINPGNSGGPLVNIYGEAIGMNTAIFSRSGGSQGIGFAIPSNILKDVSDKLVATGRVQRAYLGVYIQNLTSDLSKEFGLNSTSGALVTDVEKGGPADQAGIKSGDIVIAIAGENIKDSEDLKYKVAMAPIGKHSEFTLFKAGKTRKVSVYLAERSDEEGPKGAPDSMQKNLWGMELSAQPFENPYGNAKRSSGVYVVALDPVGVAARSGLQVGDKIVDVNHAQVNTPKDFFKVSNGLSKLLLRVQRGDYHLYFKLTRK